MRRGAPALLLLLALLAPVAPAHAGALPPCAQAPWTSFAHCRAFPAGTRVEWRAHGPGKLSWAAQPQGNDDFTLVMWLFAPRPGGRFATQVQVTTQVQGVASTRVFGEQLPGLPGSTGSTVIGGAGRLPAGVRVVLTSDVSVLLGYTSDRTVPMTVDRRWQQSLPGTQVENPAGSVSADLMTVDRGSGHVAVAVLPCDGSRVGAGTATLTGPGVSRSLKCPGSSSAVITSAFGSRPLPVWQLSGSWVGPATTRFVLLTTAVD